MLFNTPREYVRHLEAQADRLGLAFASVDHSGTGIGYAKGLNGLITQFLNDYDVLFLANPDIRIESLPKDELFAAAEHFAIWGYAMRQHGRMYYGGMLDRWRMSGGLVAEKPETRFSAVHFVSGSLMGVKTSVLKDIGLFEEAYGMYYEDADICLRAWRAGYSVGIDCAVWYEHLERSDENPMKPVWLRKSRFRFLMKFGSFKQKVYEFLRLPKTWWEEGW